MSTPLGDTYDVTVLRFDASLNPAGTLSATVPFHPAAVAAAPNGDLWMAGIHTLARIDSSGHVVLSVPLGGSDPNGVTGVAALAVGASGTVAVTGTTSQSDFPVSPGAFQKFPSISIPPSDVSLYDFGFISTFSDRGVRLASTIVAGTNPKCPSSFCAFARTEPVAITLDAQDTITVAGTTNTLDFPVTPGAPQPMCDCHGAQGNIFITRFSADLRTQIWSTFLGGAPDPYFADQTESVTGLALEPDGGAVVAGTTYDLNFPATPGALQPKLPPAKSYVNPISGFVTRINATGTAWVSSTYLTGTKDDSLAGVQTDPQGNAWISGNTQSPDFPTIAGGLQLGSGLIVELAADGSRLLTSEHIPGAAPGGILSNPDGSFTIPDSSAAFYGTESLLRVPPGAIGGISILGVADSAVTANVVGTVAPGEFLSVYGTGLGPSPGVGAVLNSSGRLSNDVANVLVFFDGQPMPLLWVSANQINVLVPYEIGGRSTTTMQVSTPGGWSQTLKLFVVPTQPNIFVVVNSDGTVNSPDHPAAIGDILTLYGSGAGVLDRTMPDGSVAGNPAPRPDANVSILLPRFGNCGDEALPVLYAGGSPGLAVNALQVNFQFERSTGDLNCISSSTVRLVADDGESRSYDIYYSK